MAVNCCGHQLTRLRSTSPGYFKNERIALIREHAGIAYWRSDWCLGVRVGILNIDSVGGKGEEVHEELRMMIVVCCLLEVRRRGLSSKMQGMVGW